jgi:uncharacterized membrane protein
MSPRSSAAKKMLGDFAPKFVEFLGESVFDSFIENN